MTDGSTPNWITGYAPPATEWNLWWGKKYDATSNLANIAVTATGGTTARQLGDRFADSVNVKDFGAKGDGTTDDAAAINAAIASFRALLLTAAGTTITNGVRLVFPRGTYLCKSPLNFTNLQGIGNNVSIDFSGAVLRFNLSGQVCVDALGSTQIEWRDLAISVVSGATPTIGLQVGRFATNQVASKHTFITPEVVGTFTKCAVYNFGSEENLWLHPQFANLYANTSAYVLIMDGWNHWTCTSTFVTQQLPVDAQQPFGQNTFIKPDFRNTGGGPVVWMMGSTNGRYEGIYTYTVGAAPAFVFYAIPGLFSVYRLYIQGHFESDLASPN